MDGSARIVGLEGAMKAMQSAFPDNIKIQSQIINGAMGGAARKAILPHAKRLAKKEGGSGALSESLKVRAQKARQRKGRAGGMEITPVRFDKKALALYITDYTARHGKPPGASIISQGIKYGHLVEFGHNVRGGGSVDADPFLWPAAKLGEGQYKKIFSSEIKKRIEARVKREAKKRAKK